MSMNVGDVLQILDQQTLLGQEVMNVYYYKVDVNTGGLYDESHLADEFITNIVEGVATIQSSLVNHVVVTVNNLTQPIRFASQSSGVDGILAGDVDDSFTAVGFTFNRDTRLTRNGQKRIAGIPQTWVAGNVIDASYMDTADALAVTFELCLTIEVSSVVVAKWCPVIVGRNIDGSHDLARINTFSSVTAKNLVTSQVSRKQRL